MRKVLPTTGRPWEELETEMVRMRAEDADWRRGRLPYYIWYGGDEVAEVQRKSYAMFMQENGVGAGKAFQSLKHMEDDVLEFSANLLRGEDAIGHITSGGSESIFVAMKAARDWARVAKPHITLPEVVLPFSGGHPTFNRAGEYLGLRIVRVPVGRDFRADPLAMERAISTNTIALAASAPCFPFGVIDPIEQLSACAQAHHLWLHVDACVGGYSAPFVRDLGYPIPNFDFGPCRALRRSRPISISTASAQRAHRQSSTAMKSLSGISPSTSTNGQWVASRTPTSRAHAPAARLPLRGR